MTRLSDKYTKRRILVLARYSQHFASTRLRLTKFIPGWEHEGWEVEMHTLFGDRYQNFIYHKKFSIPFAWYLLSRYLSRIAAVLGTRKVDVVLVQFEVLPMFPSWLERYLRWKNIPYVLDFDDAFFHNYDASPNRLIRLLLKNKFADVVRRASWVITGSPYLTRYAEVRNQHVTEIATGVEFSKYNDAKPIRNDGVFTIGWIGSPYTSQYIDDVAATLLTFLSQHNARLMLIGYKGEAFQNGGAVEIHDWSELTEAPLLQSIDVGIMPLRDDAFSRGKCGFKLIQYMACGKPTISTPLEANLKIDGGKGNLFASNADEWFTALERVYTHGPHFAQVGLRNQVDVRDHYNVEKNYLKYLSIFESLIHDTGN